MCGLRLATKWGSMDARLAEFTTAMAHLRAIVQQHVRDVSTHMETVAAYDFDRMTQLAQVQHQITESHQRWLEASMQLYQSVIAAYEINAHDPAPTHAVIPEPLPMPPPTVHPILQRISQVAHSTKQTHSPTNDTQQAGRHTLKLEDDWQYTKPKMLLFAGQEYVVTGYRDMYQTLLLQIYKMHAQDFVSVLNRAKKRGTRPFVSADPQDFLVAVPVGPVFVEGNLSANAIRNCIQVIVHAFRITEQVTVVVRV